MKRRKIIGVCAIVVIFILIVVVFVFSLQKVKANYEATIKEKDAKIELLSEENAQIKIEMSNLKEENDNLNQLKATYEEDVVLLQTQIDDLKQQLEIKIQEGEEKDAEIQTLQENISSLEKTLEFRNSQIQKLKKTISSNETEMSELNQKLQDAQEEITRLEEESKKKSVTNNTTATQKEESSETDDSSNKTKTVSVEEPINMDGNIKTCQFIKLLSLAYWPNYKYKAPEAGTHWAIPYVNTINQILINGRKYSDETLLESYMTRRKVAGMVMVFYRKKYKGTYIDVDDIDNLKSIACIKDLDDKTYRWVVANLIEWNIFDENTFYVVGDSYFKPDEKVKAKDAVYLLERAITVGESNR